MVLPVFLPSRLTAAVESRSSASATGQTTGMAPWSLTRPALVLTTKEFNRLGDALVAPITQGGEFSRYAGFAVSLMGTGCRTQGAALLNKIRMLDLKVRKARKIERVPQAVLDDALGRLTALLDG